ncbi:hypothetical protein EDI_118720 [Entamoeba dispar SAW760]|uniref:Uncharacterized protein n=1 Tax=Entamoeba dispar (strain ATCC PRA-260 / SAW760) TaxID=370354 RepID=B0E9V0_ENTDS|nr:uncharacterized protein EDI_118720 [Entamoeba dispar SAW760]EDR28695.1 hypothetical protein EDI_118720 [Entamoeba dispar SAW760]|eukprot:EDR28695.1 hypothetical protein EDI_118720 [Entamoeba dispar SAW760]
MFFDLYGVPRLNLHKKRYGSYGSIRSWYGNYKLVNKKPYTYQRVYDRSPSNKRNEFDKRYNRDYDKRHEETKPRRPDSNRPQRPTNKRPTQDRRPSQKDKPINRPENKRPVQDRRPDSIKKPRHPSQPEQRKPIRPTQKPSKINDKYDPDLDKIINKQIKEIEDKTDKLFDKNVTKEEKQKWLQDVKDTLKDRVKDISDYFPEDLTEVIKKDPKAKLEASLFKSLYDAGIKVGKGLMDGVLPVVGGAIAHGIKDAFSKPSDNLLDPAQNNVQQPVRQENTHQHVKYLREKYKQHKPVTSKDLENIKQIILADPSLVKDYVRVVFTPNELGKLYEEDPDYGPIALPLHMGDRLFFVPPKVLSKNGSEYFVPSYYLNEDDGIIISPEYQNKLLAANNEFELFPGSLSGQYPEGDDFEEYNSRRLTFLFSQLPPELRRHIENDFTIDHAAAYRYAKLLKIDVPKELRTGDNDEYYHKINWGMRTHERFGSGRRYFEPGDFEKRSDLIKYMREHYLWKRDDKDHWSYPEDPDKSGFNYLKRLGSSDNFDDWGKVLLKMSPTDPDSFKVYTRPDGRKVFVEYNPDTNKVLNIK